MTETITASVSAVPGATSYVWTLPTGLTGTSTTNSITITGAVEGTYAAGTISVTATNDCGTTAASYSTEAVSVVMNPGLIPAGSGSFAGRTCFDVAQVNDAGECGNLTSRQNETLAANGSRADFSNALTRNQTYTFTPSGTVSNVRFYAVESEAYTGQIIDNLTGGNPGNNITSSTPVTCNITYRADLNSLAEGKTNTDALTVDIYVVYNDKGDGTGEFKKLKLTAMIKDCACCGAKTVDGGWLNFMCYNLGADPTLTTPEQIRNAPTAKTWGNLYQWGKRKPWPATGTATGWSANLNTNPDQPGGNSDLNAWGAAGGKTVADPCPAGWRVPSRPELFSLWGNGTPTTWAAATANIWQRVAGTTVILQIGNSLALPYTSHRVGLDDVRTQVSNYQHRDWNPNGFEFAASGFNWDNNNDRNWAFAVRCVAE
jgi:hypothetical protein